MDGEHVVRLTRRTKDKTFTTLVAADAPHHVLQIDTTDEAGGALIKLAFAHFDEPFEVTAPKPSEVTRMPSQVQG